MISGNAEVKFALASDLVEIVQVHKLAFPKHFLTTLGDRFLYRFYGTFLQRKNCILMVATLGGKIIGFSAGRENGYENFLSSEFFSKFILYCSATHLFVRSPAKFLRRFYDFIKAKKCAEIDGRFDLLSIAITPSCQHKGIGALLLSCFENHCREMGVKKIVLTTDADNNTVALKFYREHKFNIESHFTQGEDRKMVMLTKQLSFR